MQDIRLTISLLLFLVYSKTTVFAQENYYIKKYTTENGLAHNVVRDIVKDRTGFIWIATFDGLSRFDGYEFKNYQHSPGDSTTITNFDATHLEVDSNNNVWLQVNSGLICRYNRANDRFIRYKIRSISSGKYFFVQKITTYHLGGLWIIGQDGLMRYNYDSNCFVYIKLIDEKGKNYRFGCIPLFGFDQNGNIWIEDNELIKCELIKNAN